ncbi:MAG: DUF4347 domain-containing protein [Spirulina sp. SIO3F2]|nr:DUF4347 domain-containing protein [Spirulina sp. SIO3F2]
MSAVSVLEGWILLVGAIAIPRSQTIFGVSTLSLLALFCLSRSPAAIAQSITAAPDGTGTVINHNGQTYTISGGTQAGANLFHSFEQFGLQPSEIADFLSNPALQNVVGRVVGGDPSVIEGLIRLSGGNSNLFLVNPAGWVFTQGAALDVPGSFGVTTANRIGFGSEFFNVIGSNDYAALTGEPTSLIFDSAQPGAIINGADLQVDHGSLWFVGGSVISTGSIAAPNGTVTLAAVPGQSQVKLSHEGMVLDLVLDAIPAKEHQPDTPLGLASTDLPRYLTGGDLSSATGLARADDGTLWLVGSNLRVDEAGNTIIGETVTAENVNLFAAGHVTPSDPGLITGDVTVVRYPEADGSITLSAIDSRADNPYTLLYGGAAGTIAQIIDRDEDGISVISEQLSVISAAGAQVDAVSITAEGHEGNFWLGNAWITHETVQDYRTQFSSWRDALTEQADLLLYSCFTALGTTGETLVNTLAALTGADVAASMNATGSAKYSGDWQLEQSTGLIEVETPFTDATLEVWDGKLATLTVADFGDSGAGTLRQRIQTDAAAGDMITFASAGTVTLTSGDIDWSTNNLTLDGTGAIVDGNSNERIFDITANTTTIQNLTIRNGSTTTNGGGIRMADNTTLTVLNSTISGNTASNKGGGIYFGDQGTLNLSNSSITGNVSALGDGGGLSFQDGANITINDSSITNNIAVGNSGGDHGGGIYTRYNATVTLTNTMVSGNSSGRGDGGGIRVDNGSIVTLTNSTITGNSSGDNAGGIYLHDDGMLTLINSTVSNNLTADDGDGGGINFEQNGILIVTNSTISNNRSGSMANDQGGGVYFRNTGTAIITNSTIANNSAGDDGGGLHFYNNGTATLTNSIVSGNLSGNDGGGIYFGDDAVLNLTSTTISNNSAGDDAGGVHFYYDGTATIKNSTLSGNRSGDDGGALHFDDGGVLTLTNATVSGNSTREYGGGIYFIDDAQATLRNATISGNTAGDDGGGLHFNNNANLTTTNVTIAFNISGDDGGGIYLRSGTGTLNNTIVSNNSASSGTPDLFGTFTANYSLILNTNGATLSGNNKILGQDPLLQPLAFNGGGPAQTHALAFNSPAINGGSNALALAAGLTTDQSTIFTRIFGGTVDIGAYEVNPDYLTNPFTFAEIYLDSLYKTEALVDEVLSANACRTVPEVERGVEGAEEITELEETEENEGGDRDQNCLPVGVGKVKVSGF